MFYRRSGVGDEADTQKSQTWLGDDEGIERVLIPITFNMLIPTYMINMAFWII